MTAEEVKLRAIEEGLAEVRATYTGARERYKLEGATAGFEACRALHTPEQFRAAIAACEREAHTAAMRAGQGEVSIEDCWRLRWKMRQIEHVAEVCEAAWRESRAAAGVPR